VNLYSSTILTYDVAHDNDTTIENDVYRHTTLHVSPHTYKKTIDFNGIRIKKVNNTGKNVYSVNIIHFTVFFLNLLYVNAALRDTDILKNFSENYFIY